MISVSLPRLNISLDICLWLKLKYNTSLKLMIKIVSKIKAQISATITLFEGVFINRSAKINMLENVKTVMMSTRNPISNEAKNSIRLKFEKSST